MTLREEFKKKFLADDIDEYHNDTAFTIVKGVRLQLEWIENKVHEARNEAYRRAAQEAEEELKAMGFNQMTYEGIRDVIEALIEEEG